MNSAVWRLLLLCLAAGLIPFWPSSFQKTPPQEYQESFAGWPREWQGLPLRQLPLADYEQAFGTGFPGRLARFTDGRRQIVIRWITQATRKLHPASDCFRALGYDISPLPAARTSKIHHLHCFLATAQRDKFHVCEWVQDDRGGQWSDISQWFWQALMSPESGPWWSYTVAEPLSP
ncbi:MAG: hypothetical protein HQL56_03050 [Magnetococcales bacterium]|nr:hypothetical protein [Magnetococcales bacterium]